MTDDASSDAREREFEQLLTAYVDRMLAGEILDKDRIAARHPEHARELVEKLEVFLQLGASSRPDGELGVMADYALERQIGRGGMGIVYEAWQRSMDRRVALKVLPSIVATDDRSVARFLREARIAGKLRHPAIVPVFSVGIEDGVPYYAMELVEGQTLSAVCEHVRASGVEQLAEEYRALTARLLADADLALAPDSGRESDHGAHDEQVDGTSSRAASTRQSASHFARAIASALADVADGLGHAHELGVVHRDVKPSNIMLDRHGRLRLVDFGLACIEGSDSITRSADLVGTPLYMSPEQARRQKVVVDHRTDIYSLGATLYELMTLEPPFRGRDHADTLSRIIHEDPRSLRARNPHVPRDLENIVLKCLRKEPQARYERAGDLAADLRRFARGEAVEATAEPRWRRWKRSLARRRASVLVGFLIALLILTWGLVWIGGGSPDRRFTEEDLGDALAAARKLLANPRPIARWSTQRQILGPAGLPGREYLDTEPPLDDLTWDTRFESIRQRLATASLRFPADPDAPFLLARLGLRTGDLAGARASLAAAVERGLAGDVLRRLERDIDDVSRADTGDFVDRFGELAWSRAFGGSASDEARDVIRLAGGDLVVVGVTDSIDFPIHGGRPYVGGGDVFVARFDQDGRELVFSSCLGGAHFDAGLSAVALASDRVAITGYTHSTDFPVTAGALQSRYAGRRDAFLVCLDPRPDIAADEQLLYATYLGGHREDSGTVLATGASGRLTLTGYTASPAFPTTRGAFSSEYLGGATDLFLAQFDVIATDRDWELSYSSFIGGSGSDANPRWLANREMDQGLHVDANGLVTLIGGTESADFPTSSGALDESQNGGIDAFVLRLAPSPSASPAEQLVHGTLIGGGEHEAAVGLDVGADGVVTVVGWTWSRDFPITDDACQKTVVGANDWFVAQLVPGAWGRSRDRLLYSTFLGGKLVEAATAVLRHESGLLAITGAGWSPEWIIDGENAGGIRRGPSNGYLVFLDPQRPPAEQLLGRLSIGGFGSNVLFAVTELGPGALVVAGVGSFGYPTRGDAGRAYRGGFFDAVLTRIDMPAF